MIVVTGGAGFIGSNLVAALGESGRGDVVVVDRLRCGDKWRNLQKHAIAELVHPDRLFDFLATADRGIEIVFHLGAVSSTTEVDADLVVHTNFSLTQKLWRWCAQNGVRLIYASSAATYGDGSSGFDDEAASAALRRLRPLNSYGWSKHLFDRWAIDEMEQGRAVPPQWAGLKFFNVYGPNEYHKGAQQSLIAQIFPRAAAGEPTPLFRSHNPQYPDGGQLRDFVWIDDVVAIMVWLLDHPGVCGIFNAGSGIARSWQDLAAAVYRALAKTPQITYIDMPEQIRENYQYYTQAGMERLEQAGCKLSPTSLEDGVSRYVQQFLARKDRYR
jgi:ADP-L-glycero-D-manno-heptose 6-epimerase